MTMRDVSLANITVFVLFFGIALEHVYQPRIPLQSQDCGCEAQRLTLGVSTDTLRVPPGLLARNPAISR
jgi:hypothetical protein